ncbi:MAG: hypothetical protein ACI845_001574 [Gammaproteobacteria bacterium]|jgi:hypothetical protein
MKLLAKLLVFGLVIAFALPFTVLKGRDGKPLMSLSNIELPGFSMPDFSDKDLPKGNSNQNSAVQLGLEGKDIFYKWFDSEGNLQFTTSPPPEGVEFTVKGIDPNTNLIQAVKPVVKEVESALGQQGQKGQSKSAKDIGNPYSPEKVEKLFDDAQNIEKLLNDRLKNQEAALGQ